MGHPLALLWGYGGEPLCLEEFNACSLGAEVGLQAHQDDRGGWAEMKDLGIPLFNLLDCQGKNKKERAYLVHHILQ
jgi:hypothetical protein